MAVLSIGLLLCKGSLAKKGLILQDSLMSWIREDGLWSHDEEEERRTFFIDGVPMRKKMNKQLRYEENEISCKLPPLILLIQCIIEFAVIQSNHYQKLHSKPNGFGASSFKVLHEKNIVDQMDKDLNSE